MCSTKVKVAALFLVGLLASNAYSIAMAATVRFSGSVTTNNLFSYWLYRSPGANELLVRLPATRFVDVTINSVGPTSFYNSLSYGFSTPSVYSWTEMKLKPNTFETIPITTTITIDPINIVMHDYGPRTLTPWNNSTLSGYLEPLNSLGQPGEDLFDPLTVTGSFSISSPNDSASGQFSHAFDPRSATSFLYDLLGLPNQLRMMRLENAAQFDDFPNFVIFDGHIDTVPWYLGMGNVGFDAEFDTWRRLSVVPEPSTLALAALGLVSFAAWHWQRKR